MAKQQSKKQPEVKKTLPNWIWLALIGLTFVLIYPYIFDEKVNLGGDNAGYYILGESIASGNGFKDIHMTGAPAHNHFPPGYPAILGAAMVFTKSIAALKVYTGLFLLGTALLMFLLLKRFTDNKLLAFSSAILLLFNFHLLGFSTILMSEVPFLFFATLAMLLFMKSQGDKPFYKNYNFYLLLVVSSFAFHIRTAGIALVAGFALYMLINKNWKMFGAYLVGFVALGIPWFMRGQNLGGSNYIKQLFLKNPYRPEEGAMEIGDWFVRFGENFMRYLGKEIPNGLFPGLEVGYTPEGESHVFVGLIILAISVFAIIKLPKYRWILAGYLIGSFGILLLWPNVWFGIRFVLPLLPFLLFLLVFGVYELLSMLLAKVSIHKKPSPLLFLIFALFFIPEIKLLKEQANTAYPDKFKNYFETGVWANTNLPTDAVISTRKPSLFYLFAARKVSKFDATSDYNDMLARMDQNGVTHVVVDQLGYSDVGRYLVPLVQDNPEKFGLVNQIPNPDTYLLQYTPTVGYNGEWRIEEKDGYFTHTREGNGTLTYPDGTQQTGVWKDGQLIETTHEQPSK